MNIETLKSSLPIIQKVRLNVGLEGYDNPDVYGIYKQGGGKLLGVSKESFTPANLSLFLDTIVNSLQESKLNLDINKIKFNEYKGGKKVVFRIPLKEFEIETPMKGDVLKTSLLFSTGFDTRTTSSLTFSTYRLWCENGAKNWQNDYSLSFKNTKNNADKYLLFTDEIVKSKNDVEDYVKYLGELSKRRVTAQQVDDFYFKLTGVNKANYENAHGKSKNIFNALQNSFMIESNNTGMNAFSLLQAATRYSSHELAEVEEDLYFGHAATVNQLAHQVIYNLN